MLASLVALLAAAAPAAVVAGAGAEHLRLAKPDDGGGRAQIRLARVAEFASMPEPFELMDWRARTARLD